MALKPPSTKASRIAKDVGSSTLQPNTWVPSISGARRSSDRPSWRNSISAQAGVDLVERGLTWAEVLFAKRIERRIDRAQVAVEVIRVAFDIEQAGDDLPLGGVVLEETQSRSAVVHVVV